MMKMHGGAISGVVVEDDVDINTSTSPTQTMRSSKRFVTQQPTLLGLQRPKATRPSDIFYAETEKANIAFHHVHAAVQETHEWENTWLNRINEVNPLIDTDHDAEDDALWSAAIDIIERDRGARNPSPTDHRVPMKRTLPHPTNPAIIGDDVRDHYDYPQQQPAFVVATAPTAAPTMILVRPKAMRVTAVIEPQLLEQPTYIPNAEDNRKQNNVWIIPYEIKQDLSSRSLSPITTKSGDTSSSTGTRTTTDGPHQSDRLLRGGASMMMMNVIEDDEHGDYCVVFPPKMMNIPKPQATTAEVLNAREGLLYQLAISGGETTSAAFLDCLTVLQDNYMNQVQAEYENSMDGINNPYSVHEGTWLTLTKPTFFGCLGENDNGDPLYSLGRMTFDMFTPSNLICSLQGNFNTVHEITDPTTVPDGLLSQVGNDVSNLRTYQYVSYCISFSVHLYCHSHCSNQNFITFYFLYYTVLSRLLRSNHR